MTYMTDLPTLTVWAVNSQSHDLASTINLAFTMNQKILKLLDNSGRNHSPIFTSL